MSPMFDVGQDGGGGVGDVVERRSCELNTDVNREIERGRRYSITWKPRDVSIFDHDTAQRAIYCHVDRSVHFMADVQLVSRPAVMTIPILVYLLAVCGMSPFHWR